MQTSSKSSTAEQIRETEKKSREIKVYPWMAVYMSRVWQEMRRSISEEIKHKPTASGESLTAFGTEEPPRSAQ